MARPSKSNHSIMSNSTTTTVSSSTTLRANSDYTNQSSPPRSTEEKSDQKEQDHGRTAVLPSRYDSPPIRTRTIPSNDPYIHSPIARFQGLPQPNSPNRKRASTLNDQSLPPPSAFLQHRVKTLDSKSFSSPPGRSATTVGNYTEEGSPGRRRSRNNSDAGSRAANRRSGVWDELESVKERLHRLKVGSTSIVPSEMLPPVSSPSSLQIGRRASSRQYTSNVSEDDIYDHSHRQRVKSISPIMKSPVLGRTPNLAYQAAGGGGVPTQAEMHLRDVLERARRSRGNIGVMLLDRAATDLLHVYNITSDPQIVEGLDRACLSMASFILQTLDNLSGSAGGNQNSTCRPETPVSREPTSLQQSPKHSSGGRQAFRARPYLGPSSNTLGMPRAASSAGFTDYDDHDFPRGVSALSSNGFKISTPVSQTFSRDLHSQSHSLSQPLPRTQSSLARASSLRSSTEYSSTPSKTGFNSKERNFHLGSGRSFSQNTSPANGASGLGGVVRRYGSSRRTHSTLHGSGVEGVEKPWAGASTTERTGLERTSSTREDIRRKRHSLTFI